MHEIFISYSHKDHEWVSKFAGMLENHGYKVWWDKELLFSQDYADIIDGILNSTPCIITVWSSNSVKSKWVRAESGRGFNQNKILPVLIEDANIPIPYDSLHTADFRSWQGEEDDKSFVDLINSLNWILKRENTVPVNFATMPLSVNKTLKPFNFKSLKWLPMLGLITVMASGWAYYLSYELRNSPQLASNECIVDENSIIKASGRGRIDRVIECIKLGTDLSLKDTNGWTVLHASARNGNLNIVRRLMATGKVDIEAKTHLGMTPIYLASINAVQVALKSKNALEIKKLYEVISYLRNSGADTSVADIRGQNLYSRVRGTPELLKLLFD